VNRALLTSCVFLTAAAATNVHAGTCAFNSARSAFANLIDVAGLPGGAILVGGRQGVFAEYYLGTYDANTVVPVASASKLLSATRVLQASERGEVDLDASVSTYLPEFSGDKGTMTVRQMFSHTAGYGDDTDAAILAISNITLAQAVAQIACCRPLNDGYTVGGQFSYGGISMHIAGRVIEVVESGDWQALWQQELGTPLGTSTIDWQGLGPTQNYRIAGGAQSNLRDYAQILHMLANEGRGNDQRSLRASTIRELWADNVGSLPVAYAPANVAPPVRYGLGSWLYNDRPSTSAPLVHSLGAFGFFPWVDFERQIYGIFMIQGNTGINNVAVSVYDSMLDSIKTQFDANACTPIEWTDEIFVGEFEPD
jgi:CubicO group peptidase (beta-lactamase class C family)